MWTITETLQSLGTTLVLLAAILVMPGSMAWAQDIYVDDDAIVVTDGETAVAVDDEGNAVVMDSQGNVAVSDGETTVAVDSDGYVYVD